MPAHILTYCNRTQHIIRVKATPSSELFAVTVERLDAERKEINGKLCDVPFYTILLARYVHRDRMNEFLEMCAMRGYPDWSPQNLPNYPKERNTQ